MVTSMQMPLVIIYFVVIIISLDIDVNLYYMSVGKLATQLSLQVA